MAPFDSYTRPFVLRFPMSIAPSLHALDQAHHLHPFTHHLDMEKTGGTHIIQSGSGVYVYDQDNRPLLDGLAGLWCVNVGYDSPEIRDAISEQLERLPFYCSFFNSTTEPAIRLAATLSEIAPPRLNHTMFCNSGSEAAESALKTIRGYYKILGKPEKKKIITRSFAYHGVTLGATSLTGLPSCYLPFDLPLEGFIHVPGPHPYAAHGTPQGELDAEAYGAWCIEQTAAAIEREGAHTIAALFAEPIQGAGGVIVPPLSYLKALRQLCRDHDILYVSDEVITGFGRVGDWFASNPTTWDLDPDILNMAKGLTSGYLPLGATMVSDEIAAVLKSGGYFAHGYTYSGHPVSSAAALANIDVINKKKLLPYVKDDIGPYFQKKLHAVADHRAVSAIRGFGLLGALELIPRGGRTELTPSTVLGVKAAALVRNHGAIVRGIRDLIAISPPLIITHEEVDRLFASIKRGLDELWD